MRSRSEAKRLEREEPKKRETAAVSLDPVNEMVVIAAACVDKRVADKLLPTTLPESFYGKGHADIWAGLREMQSRGMYYDPATLTAVSAGKADSAYVEQIVRDRPAVPPNLAFHVEMLKWDRAVVDAVRGPITEFLDIVKDPSLRTPEKLRGAARAVASAFDGFGSQSYLRDATRLVEEQVRVMEARLTGNATYPFGIEGLDFYSADEPDPRKRSMPRMVPGLAPRQVSMMTGVSGSGKSTSACWVAIALANAKRKVCFGAWEAKSGPTLELCATLSRGASRSDLMAGRFSADDLRTIREEMERLAEYIRFFELPFGKARGEKMSNDRNLDLIQQVVADSNAEVFIADLMRRALKETDPDDEEQACFRLQAMADEMGTHQMWLHQLKMKDLEGQRDPRPTRASVKGSSAWVEVPDTIIAWHRPALFKSIPDDRIEALILKQRWGEWPIAVEFDWDPEFGSITNGRSLDYARPGEVTDVDSMLGESQSIARGGKRRRSSGGRD